MKKLALFVMALLLVFANAALAETYYPEFTVDMEKNFEDGVYDVGFSVKDVEEHSMIVSIYEEVIFDTVAVHEMKVGDHLAIYEDMEIKSIVVDENNWVQINGGYEQDGVTLYPAESGGIYHTVSYNDCPLFVIRGQAQLTLADEVELEYWTEDEQGTVAAENETVKVPCGELQKTIMEKLEAEEFVPGSATVEMTNGIVTKVTVDFAPFG